MLVSIFVFVIVYALMITEKLDRTAAAVFGAAAVLLLHGVPYEEALAHIDLDVILLLIGMMMSVDILAQTGLFEWVAIYIAQRARGNPLVILLGLLSATALLSAFLDNVTTVVLMAPVTILITQILELPTVSFLTLSVLFSNIGGTATLIGDPPNIIIGARSGLSFNAFLLHLTPAVLLCMGAVFIGIFVLKGNTFKTSPALRTRIMKASPSKAILDPRRLKRGLLVFFCILVGFSASRFLGVQPGIIAIAGGFCMVLLTRSDLRSALIKVEWETILFLMGLFMLVGALEHNGLFEQVARFVFGLTQGHLFATTLLVLWCSALLSAFFGNIPVVIAMIPLVNSIITSTQLEINGDPQVMAAFVAGPLWWSLALGACFGGNGTLYGAAANVVVSQIAKHNGYRIAFVDFLRFSVPVTLLTLVISSLYIYLRYFIFSPL
ncbi:MAG TPA: ArsB/NhaD family transporter [Candidatus Hydrogenedentes bacterium]|jgi:Na+/H+ antiporter NhaD/arsenite permease-like protein|nr:MAG: Inner membrane protein YbiR [Candidatus Hydrogenedentes bacterium ADurb.Bin179]HOC70821.1 ArsB/NhaD family transporter [Candidatus Hydrogenedentota bacterium]